jgi:hypothetical protein
MDGMEELLSSLTEKLPYFSPFGVINESGVCATSRLLQCRLLGLMGIDMSRKVRRLAADPPKGGAPEYYK